MNFYSLAVQGGGTCGSLQAALGAFGFFGGSGFRSRQGVRER